MGKRSLVSVLVVALWTLFQGEASGFRVRGLQIRTADPSMAQREILEARKLGFTSVQLAGEAGAPVDAILRDRQVEYRIRFLIRAAVGAGLEVMLEVDEGLSANRESLKDLITLFPDLHGLLLVSDEQVHSVCHIHDGLQPTDDRLPVQVPATEGGEGFYRRPHPLIAAEEGPPVVVEIDLSAEKWGENGVPICIPEEIERRVEQARQNGAVGIVGRMGTTDRPVLGTFGEANLFALAHCIEGGTDALRVWCEKRYGPAVAPDALAVLAPTFEIGSLLFFPLGAAIDEETPEERDFDGLAPAYRRAALESLRPDESTIRMVRGRIERAEELIDRCLFSLRQAKERFDPMDSQKLRAGFEYLADFAETQAMRLELILRLRRFERAETTGEETEYVEPEVVRSAERLLAQIERIENEWGRDVWPGSPGEIRDFVLGPRVRRFRRGLLPTPIYEAPERGKGIIVDGDLKDWEGTTAIVLDRPDQIRGCRAGSGADVLSATVHLAWDAGSLWFAAAVEDSDFRTAPGKGLEVVGDGIVFGFDPENDGAEFRWDEDDVVVQCSRVGGLNVLRRRHGFLPAAVGASDLAVRRTEGITFYEGRLDWRRFLGLRPPVVGGETGFSVLVVDRDAGAPERRIEWTQGLADRDAEAWGKIRWE